MREYQWKMKKMNSHTHFLSISSKKTKPPHYSLGVLSRKEKKSLEFLHIIKSYVTITKLSYETI